MHGVVGGGRSNLMSITTLSTYIADDNGKVPAQAGVGSTRRRVDAELSHVG